MKQEDNASSAVTTKMEFDLKGKIILKGIPIDIGTKLTHKIIQEVSSTATTIKETIKTPIENYAQAYYSIMDKYILIPVDKNGNRQDAYKS